MLTYTGFRRINGRFSGNESEIVYLSQKKQNTELNGD